MYRTLYAEILNHLKKFVKHNYKILGRSSEQITKAICNKVYNEFSYKQILENLTNLSKDDDFEQDLDTCSELGKNWFRNDIHLDLENPNFSEIDWINFYKKEFLKHRYELYENLINIVKQCVEFPEYTVRDKLFTGVPYIERNYDNTRNIKGFHLHMKDLKPLIHYFDIDYCFGSAPSINQILKFIQGNNIDIYDTKCRILGFLNSKETVNTGKPHAVMYGIEFNQNVSNDALKNFRKSFKNANGLYVSFRKNACRAIW